MPAEEDLLLARAYEEEIPSGNTKGAGNRRQLKVSDLIKVYLVCYLCNFSAFFFCLRRVLRFLHVQTKAGNLRRTKEEGSEGRRQGRTTRSCGNTEDERDERDGQEGWG